MNAPRPRLLDLFCGAGGAAMGYHRAGFDVVGVDHRPQPHYPFEFLRRDVLTFVADYFLEEWPQENRWSYRPFDAIHASPPCQAYSSASDQETTYADLYESTRALVIETGLPWVLENVIGAPYRSGVVLCGSQFGMRVRRHRNFETSFPIMVNPCNHAQQGIPLSVTGTGYGGKHRGHNATKPTGIAEAREVMGIDWMTIAELSQAVPPAYTEFIGAALLEHAKASRNGNSQTNKEAQ